MSSWKLGTCGCRVGPRAVPYPYFHATAATCVRVKPSAQLVWSGKSQLEVGDWIKFKDEASFDRASLLECTVRFTAGPNEDPRGKAVEIPLLNAVGNQFYFRFGSFPLTSEFSQVRGALWAPPHSPPFRRIVNGGGPQLRWPEWEPYEFGRCNFPDNSRPGAFKKWVEVTTWDLPGITPQRGRLEREYRYDPETRTESLFSCRSYDENGNRIDTAGESPQVLPPVTTGPSAPLYSSAGARFGYPNGYDPGNGRVRDFEITATAQYYLITPGQGIIEQRVSVSDPIS